MKKRRDPNPEFDLFLPIMGDLPLKDQRETMERPFFSGTGERMFENVR